MKAVANAGPLIALGKLGLVHLLSQIYHPRFLTGMISGSAKDWCDVCEMLGEEK